MKKLPDASGECRPSGTCFAFWLARDENLRTDGHDLRVCPNTLNLSDENRKKLKKIEISMCLKRKTLSFSFFAYLFWFKRMKSLESIDYSENT